MNRLPPIPGTSPAGKFDLPPNVLTLLAASLSKQWKGFRKKLKRCQKKFSEGAIHDFRIETRRLLALVELLVGFIRADRIEKTRRILKEYRDNFDDLRDAQVQLSLLRDLPRSFGARKPFARYLREREERFRRKARRQLKRLKTDKLAKLIAASRRDLDHQCRRGTPEKIIAQVASTVTAAFAQVCVLRQQINPRQVRTIHYTRIAFKKFRYMAEALTDYLPRRKFRSGLRDYQKLMGDIQDVEVLRRGLDKFLDQEEIAAKEGRRLRRELMRRRRRLVQAYLRAADRLLGCWPPPGPGLGG